MPNLIESLINYLTITYCIPTVKGTILDAGNKSVNKIEEVLP